MAESTKRKPVATPSRALGLAPTLAPTVKPSCKVEVPSETIMPREVPSAKSTPVKSPDLKKVRYEQPEVPIAPRALFQCGETTEVPYFKFKNWWGDVIHFTYHEYVVYHQDKPLLRLKNRSVLIMQLYQHRYHVTA